MPLLQRLSFLLKIGQWPSFYNVKCTMDYSRRNWRRNGRISKTNQIGYLTITQFFLKNNRNFLTIFSKIRLIITIHTTFLQKILRHTLVDCLYRHLSRAQSMIFWDICYVNKIEFKNRAMLTLAFTSCFKNRSNLEKNLPLRDNL